MVDISPTAAGPLPSTPVLEPTLFTGEDGDEALVDGRGADAQR